jgi:predicted RNA binding protein YcfA (HicA-like mRNA interferase family)
MSTADNLPRLSGKEAISIFKKAGWIYNRENDGHVILFKDNNPLRLSIPKHLELKKGTIKKLIRVSGISVSDFIILMRGS